MFKKVQYVFLCTCHVSVASDVDYFIICGSGSRPMFYGRIRKIYNRTNCHCHKRLWIFFGLQKDFQILKHSRENIWLLQTWSFIAVLHFGFGSTDQLNTNPHR